MDVQCERCRAEYEFDDALVSARGTTVKCTSCGHQFKIRRPDSSWEGGPDRWQVRTADGRELIYTSLRELQKAILGRQVARGDQLTRAGAPARPLAAIAELEPFFEEASGLLSRPRAPSIPPRPGSIPDIKAKRPSSRPPPPPPGGRPPPAVRPMASPAPPPHPLKASDAMRPRIDTLRPPSTAPGAVPAPPAVSVAPVLSAGEGAPASLREEIEPEPPSAHAPPPPPPAPTAPFRLQGQPAPKGGADPVDRRPPPTISAHDIEGSTAFPAPTVPVRPRGDAFRSVMPSLEDEASELHFAGRPRRVGGWVVAVVLLVGAGVIGLAVAKPYLAAKPAPQGAPPLDPRAAQMLADGERAMAAGDLEAANDDFTKASALAEKDARVLVDAARLAAARADVPWLELKLLPASASDEVTAAKQRLGDLSSRAKAAADAAGMAAPEQPGAILARIDALRIAGDGAGARSLVSKVIAQASQPETAYVLAALDLAEPEPLWPMVIERLRLAAAGEGNAGRARAALVYALARSGDPAGAKAELDKLAALARPYPLVAPLKTFVAKLPEPAAPKVDAGAKGAAGTVDVASLPKSAGAHTAAAGGGGGRASNDPRVLLQQAEGAKQAHDWERARDLYSSALAQNGRDSEALSGLGDVAHAQKDLAGAAQFYHRALGVNPVYLPALVGLGDVEWESGDKDQAQRTYRDVVDRFPDGTYPSRVKMRASGQAAGAAEAPAADTSGSGQ